jgi:hypothetical protein
MYVLFTNQSTDCTAGRGRFRHLKKTKKNNTVIAIQFYLFCFYFNINLLTILWLIWRFTIY